MFAGKCVEVPFEGQKLFKSSCVNLAGKLSESPTMTSHQQIEATVKHWELLGVKHKNPLVFILCTITYFVWKVLLTLSHSKKCFAISHVIKCLGFVKTYTKF